MALRFSALARVSSGVLAFAVVSTVLYRQTVHTICANEDIAGVAGRKELLLVQVVVDLALAAVTLVLAVLAWRREESRAFPAAPVALVSVPVAAYYLAVWWAIGNPTWGPCTSVSIVGL
jgi:hypothetical protein